MGLVLLNFKEINIPQPNLVLSLVSFNVGVEIGQIFIVVVAFFLLSAIYTSIHGS